MFWGAVGRWINRFTPPAPSDSTPAESRKRLVDHFKRAYQIIVGLAITEACRRIVPPVGEALLSPQLLLFGAFLVTVVPIFHGGDRSLDVRHVSREGAPGNAPEIGWQKAGYIWDVYMLLLTALLFVFMAEKIPSFTVPPTPLSATARQAQSFLHWMAIMFIFDVFVLAIDYWKSEALYGTVDDLKAYIPWMIMNAGAAVALLVLSSLSGFLQGALLFACALALLITTVRSVADYVFGRRFLFP